jgi:LysM repeat protein
MNRSFTLIVLILALLTSFAFSQQTVTVHFWANTAAVPDTMYEDAVFQVRGGSAPLTWGGDSPVRLHNLGSSDEWGSSDYWYGTAEFAAGQTIYYKFYTNSQHDTVYAGAEWEHAGWEQNVDPLSNDRVLDLTSFSGTDTVLNLQYVNGWVDKPGQYATPFTTNDSTFVVHFRVNMQGMLNQGFDATQHKVGIRGSNTKDWGQTGEMSWGSTFFLTQESDHPNGGSVIYPGKHFYSGAVHFPMQYDSAGVQWKFVVHYNNSPADDDWGNLFWNPSLEENVQFSGDGQDTTLYWRWYDRYEPTSAVLEDTVIVTFKADLSRAIADNGFTPGDTVVVRHGWNNTGDPVGKTSNRMIKQGFTNIYSVTDTVVTKMGLDLQYNYYIQKDGIQYREVFYDFTDPEGGSSAEKRKVNVDAMTLTVEDNSDDPISVHRKPTFRNLTNLNGPQDVVFSVDLRPAYYQVMQGDTLDDIQSTFDVTVPDSVFAWGVRINGPATGGWQSWGVILRDDSTRMMYDDGTHGDVVAGDSIYSATLSFDAADIVGQEFKFGVRGGDNEGGYGNNHIENIDQSTNPSFIASQFGSIDPVFYWAWDFENQRPTALEDPTVALPGKFELYQNYPNPFNPSTNFRFDIPENSSVKLVVYNILGQEVARVLDTKLKAGEYAISWNGLDNNGNQIASGVYFFKLETEKHSAVKKLVMMK